MNNPSVQDIKFNLNVPNVITSVRVLLAITIALLLGFGGKQQILAAGILLVIAAVTDWMDGFIGRKLKQTSLFGSLYDIVADEILFMPTLILAIIAGLFTRAQDFMPLNPYLYAVPALAGGVTVVAGVVIYVIKRRKSVFEFPTPTKIAKLNFWFWLAPLFLAVLQIGPDLLLAILMYLAIVSTILTFYSYLKKGSYVFTK